MKRAFTRASPAVSRKPSSPRRIAVTGALKRKSQPLARAVSARPMVRDQGVMIPGGGGVQRPPDVGREVGLPPPHLLAAEKGETRHPVGIAALLQLAEGDVVLRLQRQHQGAVDHIVHMEVFRQLGHHGVAFDIVTGHFGARQRIISRVDDAAVGPGGAHGHVVVPFDENNPRLGLGQLAGHCAADDAAADDGHVVDGMDICIFHCQPSAFMEFYRDGNRGSRSPGRILPRQNSGFASYPALRAFADGKRRDTAVHIK